MKTQHVEARFDVRSGGGSFAAAAAQAAAPPAYGNLEDGTGLSLLGEVVSSMREQYLRYLASLPSPCGAELRHHFCSRLSRSQGRPVLGEYAPFMLCDILRVPTQRAADIAVPWLMLYESSALTDDLADGQIEDTAGGAFLLQFAFTEAMCCWKELLGRFPMLWSDLQRFQRDAVWAAYSEMAGTGIPRAGFSDDLAFGRKPALAKFCAAALCALGSGRRLARKEEEGLDQLCTAVQLLDDVTDISADLQLEQSNYVATAVVRWLGALRDRVDVRSSDISDEEAVACLVLSGTLSRVAELVVRSTNSGLDLLKISSRTLTRDYFLLQVRRCEQVLEVIRVIREELADEMGAAQQALSRGTGAFHLFLKTASGGAVYQKMRNCCSIMPMASQ